MLVDFIKERGWFILNDRVKGDWTYTGARGESVIDYVVVEQIISEGITRLEIGECIDSDHHPVVI